MQPSAPRYQDIYDPYASARALANGVLGTPRPVVPQERASSHFTYSPWNWNWSTPPVDRRSREERKKDDEKETRTAVAVIAGIAMIAMAYVVGRAQSEHESISDEVNAVLRDHQYYPCPITNLAAKLANRVKRDYNIKIALKITLLGTAILALVGAVVASSPLMTTAGVVAFVALTGLAYMWGRDNTKVTAQKLRDMFPQSI